MIFQNKRLIFFAICIVLSACNGKNSVEEKAPIPLKNGTEVLVEFTPTPTSQTPQTSEPVIIEECLGTFEDFSYNPKYYRQAYSADNIIPTQYPWKTKLVFPTEHFQIYFFSGLQEVDGQTIIWLQRLKFTYPPYIEIEFEYILYFPDTGEVKHIPSENLGSTSRVRHIFFAEDGTVWGKNELKYSKDGKLIDIPMLSKFNWEGLRFEFDESGLNGSSFPKEMEEVGAHRMFLDNNNIFWFFVEDDGIYSYEPATREITRHVDISPGFLSHVLFTPENGIFFIIEIFEHSEQPIFRYSPQTRELEVYGETVSGIGYDRSSGLLMDSLEQLWLGSYGWLDKNGVWHLIHRDLDPELNPDLEDPGLFIHSSITTTIFYESTNGYIWFLKHWESTEGMAWLDPKTGESCWFTNVNGFIQEGPGQIMWLLLDDKLISYDLNP